MELGEIIHGFKIERIRKSEELKGTLYEMRHIKTGAELAFLDNKEENKLFSVAFKTLPWDDTGVFHILEHSVLAGSENYPVKEPFLDLLKSSMNTFLNAMTFPDKTMYPVSSRNEQDFINLTRVYLDAVFKPAIYTNESIFRQEGWHYEVNDGVPSYNGVVFNEMKGALSTVDGLTDRVCLQHLFPDSVYGFESGGDPKYIPDLTYEAFVNAHREFYSPTNAKIYLDGDVPLDRVLSIIDGEYLSGFDYIEKEHSIIPQAPIAHSEVTSYYAIGKEESEKDKTQLVFAKVFASWEERKRIMAYSLISSYLTGSNESPLKRAILENGLAQDVEFNVMDEISQPYYSILFRNTEPEKKVKILEVYNSVLNKIVKNGIDKYELTANFNRFEFNLRELEEPKGLIRNINALNSWLHGGDMLLYLENNEILAEMRRDIDSDYYLDIIKELLDFSNTLVLTMLPSKTKNEEDLLEESNRVNAEYNAFTDEEKERINTVYENMRKWQDTPDSPEATATLPVLSLSDVSKTPMWVESEVGEYRGVKTLFHKLDTNGIIHCNLFFNIGDETSENLCSVALMTELISLMPTAKHTSQELQKEIKNIIGAIDYSVEVIPDCVEPQKSGIAFAVKFSVLKENLESALKLIEEILLETDYSSKDIIEENVQQLSDLLYQGLISSGNVFGYKRVLSATSAASYVKEQTSGYSFFSFLKAFAKDFNAKSAQFAEYANARAKEIFTAARLTLGVTAENQTTAVQSLIDALPEGNTCNAAFEMQIQPPKQEAIIIPSGVSYAAYGANIKQYGNRFEGKLNVTSLLLTYGYLWNEIRVHGGAYGCGFRPTVSGNISFYSYRDPDPLNSLEVYKNTAEFIKKFVAGDEDVDKFIISSIAASERLMSAAMQGYDADVFYLMGYTYEDKLRTRMQMLGTKKEDLLSLCSLFEKMREGNSVCIVGSEDALSNLGEGWKIYRV